MKTLGLVVVLGWIVSFSVTGALAHDHHAVLEPQSSTPLSGESIYHLDSVWTNQEGKKVPLESFKGQPMIATMVFTTCESACPIITADLKKIESQIPKKLLKNVKFVLFSFDSKKDTPVQLKKYAKTKDLDLTRWTLLHGGEDEIREVAAILGVQYQEDPKGGFAHSNVISVIDRSGVIRHQQVGLRQDPKATVTAVKKLKK